MRTTLGPLVANGLQFHALAWGPESAPLVLLVHGFPDTPHTWDVIGPALAETGFRVVAPFTRGYAPTEQPSTDTTLQTQGEDLCALVTALGYEAAHLVGHDWGAEAAYAAVGLQSKRWRSLTAIAIPHRATLKPSFRIAWGLRHFLTLSLPGAEQRFARDDFAMMEVLIRRWSPTWRYSAEDLAPVRACFRAPGTTRAALGYYRAASALTPDFMARPVTVRTLNLAGADDPAVTPAQYEQTRAHFTAGFEVVSVPGGHFCHRESPAAVIEALRRHLGAP